MTYGRFEDLPVWKLGIEIAGRVYEFTQKARGELPHSFRDQLERAALSISNNVAEGFERGTTNELLAFLYIARGSAGEVRSMLRFLEQRFGEESPAAREIAGLIRKAEECGRQLRGWADHLQNSGIQGQRHLNERSRREYESRKKAERARRIIFEKLPENHPLRREAAEREEGGI